jgi:hypothetical protein
MALYAVQLVDMKGTAIEPGVGGSIYRSKTPLPVPRRRDMIESFNRQFRVENLIYEYTSDPDSDETVVGVTIQCSPNNG